jgi:hypothetical protein
MFKKVHDIKHPKVLESADVKNVSMYSLPTGILCNVICNLVQVFPDKQHP